MKKTSTANVLGSVENSKNTVGRKQPFWKFLCPCLRSKKSDSKDKEEQRESEKRQEFYEQKTQIEDDIHEETESNLAIKQISEFETIKREEIRVKDSELGQQYMRQVRKQELKTIKFNVKRSKNIGNYLNEVRIVAPKQEQGKQNSRPNTLTNQIYQADKDDNRIGWQRQIQQAKRQNKPSNPEGIFKKVNNNRIGVNRQQLISIEKHLQQMDDLGDYQFLQNWQDSYENHYPINKLNQNKLLLLGDKTNKMLTKVTTVKLFPSSSAIHRYKDSIRSKKLSQKYGNKDAEFNSPLDRYWDKRYFLFQRFDQGIKLDEESWYSVTPQAVADYIFSKVNVKDTILDAFCGAGGDCIKLSMSCKNIIANDIDPVKLNCLLNNAKIYDANNITISASDFFNLDCKVSAVYLAPPWGGPDYYKIQSFHPEEFQPKLSLIIEKALTLSSNLFFLLPANTDIEALATILSQKVRNAKNLVSESCSLKLQKIYFNERLKFVAGFYGNSEVQNQIKLSDQLGFIYELLSQSDDGVFKHKKLIRKVREEHGMMNLLNFLFESEIYGNSKQNLGKTWMGEQLPMIVKFERFLVYKKLIDQTALEKIKQEQQMEYEFQLRNRQNKNKKQKNKKIQKHKQKQQRHLPSSNIEQNGTKSIYISKEQCLEQEILQSGLDIPVLQIINRANQSKTKQNDHRNDLTDTINSKISSDYGLDESHDVHRRDSIRTVSMASQFHQDQLNNITYDRFTTNSDISIKDSIHPFRQYDHLQISIDQSVRNSRDSDNMLTFSIQRKHEEQSPETRSQRYSSPNEFSLKENFKMKKVKVGPKWQNGIVEDVNEDREKDY